MSASLQQIKNLVNNNYNRWSNAMQNVLNRSMHKESVTCDSESIRKEEWEAYDEKPLASSTFIDVKPTHLSYIESTKASLEAGKKIEKVNVPKSSLQKLSLYKQLINLNMNKDNVTQQIHKFMKICEQLSQNGIVMQEELLVIILLSSLSQEYENFIKAIETSDELPTLELLKQNILKESKAIKANQQKSVNSQHQRAFIAKSNNDEEKKMCCKRKKCEEKDHFPNNCEKRPKIEINGSEQYEEEILDETCTKIRNKEKFQEPHNIEKLENEANKTIEKKRMIINKKDQETTSTEKPKSCLKEATKLIPGCMKKKIHFELEFAGKGLRMVSNEELTYIPVATVQELLERLCMLAKTKGVQFSFKRSPKSLEIVDDEANSTRVQYFIRKLEKGIRINSILNAGKTLRVTLQELGLSRDIIESHYAHKNVPSDFEEFFTPFLQEENLNYIFKLYKCLDFLSYPERF